MRQYEPPPWGADSGFPAERKCRRCGGEIPDHWRHYWPPCPCTYEDLEHRRYEADLNCERCDGSGYAQCEPQDLSILRRSGYCGTCGAATFVLVRTVGEVGDIEGSAHHFEPPDDDGHEATVEPGPLGRTVGDHLARAGREDVT